MRWISDTMDDKYRWWLNQLEVRKSNMQDMRIRWKMEGYHDSLMSDDKLERMKWD